MNTQIDSSRRIDRPAQWMSRLAIFVSGFLLFETVTGLSILLLPFSVVNQVAVLVHTAAGLLFALLYVVYQLRHWINYRRYTLTHIKLTGYIAMAVMAVCGISGLILTWQAVFGRQISGGWDLVHIVTTFVFIAFVVPHIGLIYLRDRRAKANPAVTPSIKAARKYATVMSFVTLSFLGGVGLCSALYQPTRWNNRFPAEYDMPFGKGKPFSPSLATTSTGGAFDDRSLSGSKQCGQAGCHEDIYREWSISAHRWSSMDPAFQGIQTVMAKQNGPVSTRYCGGCHDPISLFSGTKNIFAANLTSLRGYNEGVSCIACHAIKQTDIKGNANYTMNQPTRYMFEDRSGATARFASNFLIRAYPRAHNATFNHRMFKSPKFCAACHKQFIDKEVNKVGWVQLQNQYDNWRKSHWNVEGNPRKTIECRECHMPLQKSQAETLARNPLDYNRQAFDGLHRSHRFLGANQFIPAALKLPGWQEQTELTNRWLKGDVEVPEIAGKWRKGPAVPIKVLAPATAEPGKKLDFAVSIGSNKVGHDFPTGPLDIIQSWLEIEAKDSAGRIVYASGRLDPKHFVEKGSFIFRAEPVDQYGNLIERHNLWEMVGVRYKRSLFPGYSDQVPFSFDCPSETKSLPGTEHSKSYQMTIPASSDNKIRISAKLRYRKIGQFLINFVFGDKTELTCPVTDLSTAYADVTVAGSRTRLSSR